MHDIWFPNHKETDRFQVKAGSGARSRKEKLLLMAMYVSTFLGFWALVGVAIAVWRGYRGPDWAKGHCQFAAIGLAMGVTTTALVAWVLHHGIDASVLTYEIALGMYLGLAIAIWSWVGARALAGALAVWRGVEMRNPGGLGFGGLEWSKIAPRCCILGR